MRLVLVLALVLLAARTAPAGDAQKKMESDKPMTTKMMKPGMKQSDVKHEADRKARRMKPALEREAPSTSKAR